MLGEGETKWVIQRWYYHKMNSVNRHPALVAHVLLGAHTASPPMLDVAPNRELAQAWAMTAGVLMGWSASAQLGTEAVGTPTPSVHVVQAHVLHIHNIVIYTYTLFYI